MVSRAVASAASWPVGVCSLLWGAFVDGYRPDRFDAVGAVICLAGMAAIMYVPRGR
ncbi:hypothetical protein [Streptomyces sp. NPDC021356]|uniref:hypothetical protein n=1 Tax=Streptomyces sp. NPDC021356 TaxID=3154900 RepID=UPI0033C2E28A